MPSNDIAVFTADATMTGEVRVCRSDLAADSSVRGVGHGRLASPSAARGDSAEAFGAYAARRARYEFYQALTSNNAYAETLHFWAHDIKAQFGLSETIQPVFNPVHRVVEFWADHLYAGPLGDLTDPANSCVPILTDSPKVLLPGIRRVLETSRWEQNASLYARTGTKLGDVGLFATNDLDEGRCYVEVIDPNAIVEYEADCTGRGTYYDLREWRDDPRPDRPLHADGRPARAIYRETGTLLFGYDGRPSGVRFATSIRGENDANYLPYAWENPAPVWDEPYPFLPLTLVGHVRPFAKSPFGQPEAASIVPKIFAADDMGSRFNQFVRIAVDSPWLFSGVKLADVKAEEDRDDDDASLKAFFANDPAAKAQCLLSALNLADVGGHLDRLKAEIEDDLPELQKAIKNATGDASGIALRTYQQGLETKAHTRRTGYDAALARSLRNCLVMGGMMGYEGYEAFGEGSDPALLEFSIAPRPLFKLHPIDQLAVEEKRLANAESAERSGIPITFWASEEWGWPADKVKRLVDAQKDAMDRGLPVGRAKQASPPNGAAAKAVQAPNGMPT